MTRTWAVNDKAKLFDYSGRHGDIGRVDYISNSVVLLDLGDCIWPVDPSDLKPVVTFAELAAERDPVYAATKPVGEFAASLEFEDDVSYWRRIYGIRADVSEDRRDAHLGRLAIRARRNQGQPYYDARQS